MTGSVTGVAAAARAVRLLGSEVALADLLGVPRGRVAGWFAGAEPLGAVHERRIVAVVSVLDRVASRGDRARSWLHRASPALDGALPLDVTLVDGPERVLAALDAEIPG
jgi:hypothetical protein